MGFPDLPKTLLSYLVKKMNYEHNKKAMQLLILAM